LEGGISFFGVFDGHGGKFFKRLMYEFRLGSGFVREEVLCQRAGEE
jgi:hypothetical protein